MNYWLIDWLFSDRLGNNEVMEVTRFGPSNWMPLCTYGFPSNLYEDLCNLLGYSGVISNGVKEMSSPDQMYANFLSSSGATNLLQQLPNS